MTESLNMDPPHIKLYFPIPVWSYNKETIYGASVMSVGWPPMILPVYPGNSWRIDAPEIHFQIWLRDILHRNVYFNVITIAAECKKRSQDWVFQHIDGSRMWIKMSFWFCFPHIKIESFSENYLIDMIVLSLELNLDKWLIHMW